MKRKQEREMISVELDLPQLPEGATEVVLHVYEDLEGEAYVVHGEGGTSNGNGIDFEPGMLKEIVRKCIGLLPEEEVLEIMRAARVQEVMES